MSRKVTNYKLPSLRVALSAPRSNLRDNQALLDATKTSSSKGIASLATLRLRSLSLAPLSANLLAVTGLEEAK